MKFKGDSLNLERLTQRSHGSLSRMVSERLSHLVVPLLGLCILVATIVFSVLQVDSPDQETNLKAALLISWQTLGGSLLVNLLFRRTYQPAPFLLASGIPLGMMLSSVVASHIPDTDFKVLWAVLAPASLLIITLFVPNLDSKVLLPQPKRLLLIAILVTPFSVSLMNLWKTYSFDAGSWWFVDGDAPSHASLAASVYLYGPTTNLAVDGGGVTYHWFTNAWLGQVTHLVNWNPYWVMTRPLLVTTAVASLAGIWYITGYLSRNLVARSAGLLLASAGLYVTAGETKLGSLLVETSPPTGLMGIATLFALSIIFIDMIQGETSRVGTYLLLFIFSMIVLGTRVFNTGIVMCAFLGAAISSWRTVGRISRSFVVAIVAVISGAGIMLSLLLLPKSFATEASAMQWSPNHDVADLMGMTPFYTTLGVWLGLLAALVAVALGAVGILYFLRVRPLVPIALGWQVGGFVGGMFLVWQVDQAGYSQLTFLSSGLILGLMASGVGAGLALNDSVQFLIERSMRVRLLGLIGFPFLLSSIVYLSWPMLIGFRFDGITRTAFPFAVLALTWSFAWIFTRGTGVDHGRIAFSSFIYIAVSMVFFVSILGALNRLTNPAPLLNPETNYGLNELDLEAGSWVRAHTSPSDIFATNRQCGLASDKPGECFSGVFTVSALGWRQALIEGHSYGISYNLESADGSLTWALERVYNSSQFGSAPDMRSLQALWHQGVRYYWVDRLVNNAGAWNGYAEVLYANDRAIILGLNDPASIQK